MIYCQPNLGINLLEKYCVLRDTSEKQGHGWIFDEDDDCSGTEKFNLFTGDYTIKGFEKELIIERKGSTAEFAQNIVQKRFKDEMERMEDFKFPFLILEFTLEDLINFPVNSCIPKKIWGKLKIRSKFLLSALTNYYLNYKTKIILAGDNGKTIAQKIFKQVFNEYRERITSA